MTKLLNVILPVTAMTLFISSCGGNPEKVDFLVGTYGDHIYAYSYDCKSKAFERTASMPASSATFLALDESGQNLFAAGEAIYSFEKTGDGWKQTGCCDEAAESCHICVNPDSDLLFSSEYGGGSLSIYKVPDRNVNVLYRTIEYGSNYDGHGPFKDRQNKSYMHQSRILPKQICDNLGINGVWLLANDLGNDVIRVGEIVKDSEDVFNELFDIPCGPGAGPRHIEFDAYNNCLYCMTELSDEVIAWKISSENGQPRFAFLQRLKANPVDAGGSADIHLSPDGKFLYGSHRLENDGISVFKVLDDGTLEPSGYFNTARHPRNFGITPDGKRMFVACKDDKCIEVYDIDTQNGSLSGPVSKLDFPDDEPVCVIFE